LIVASGYLCGAVPSGLWLGRLAGSDVRASGSGNIGATNVARVAGARLGFVVLLLDIVKGALPVLIARHLSVEPGVLALTGLAAFLGNIFPVFAGFRGGKGVATATGAFLVLAPAVVAGALVVFAAVIVRSRIVSLASLCAGVALPLFAAVLGTARPTLLAALFVAVALLLTHRENLRRLRAGKEPRFRAGG
jgi:glycerol-3-phosphate acyltransferase PlsY